MVSSCCIWLQSSNLLQCCSRGLVVPLNAEPLIRWAVLDQRAFRSCRRAIFNPGTSHEPAEKFCNMPRHLLQQKTPFLCIISYSEAWSQRSKRILSCSRRQEQQGGPARPLQQGQRFRPEARPAAARGAQNPGEAPQRVRQALQFESLLWLDYIFLF